MKNKIIYFFSAILIILLITIIIIINRNEDEEPIIETYQMHKDFIIVNYDGEEIINDYVFTSLEEYNSVFNNELLNDNDFENNNYVLVKIQYAGCSEVDVLPTDYKINGEEILVNVKYKSICGLCAPVIDYYLLKVDKSVTNANIEIESTRVSSEICDNNTVYKPLIYLYPTSKMDVKVKLLNSYNITTSYPKYNNSWEVTAYPNGKLIDKNTNRELYGLYWEGKNFTKENYEDGFIVKGEDTISFLEEKLEKLGLNEKESNEFIIYWLPKLEVNKYNFIRFESIESINSYMPLEVTPNPDTIIRVYMTYKPMNEYIDVKEQKITTQVRNGFTLVEWGGSEITN